MKFLQDVAYMAFYGVQADLELSDDEVKHPTLAERQAGVVFDPGAGEGRFAKRPNSSSRAAEEDDSIAIIDAITQEQPWFDGGADNNPPGNCLLPRTEKEVNSESYENSPSSECRRQYEDYPESILHVRSKKYLDYLFLAQEQGLPIFTVDYALDPDNAAWVHETSRSLGFVPFVGSRALDGCIEPFED